MLGRSLAGHACAGAALVIALVKGLADTVDANGVFLVVVEDVAALAILIIVVFVALSLPSRSPNVLARSRGLSHPPSVTPACFGWLLRDKILNGDHLRPSSYIIFVIFLVVQFAAPK